MVGRLAVVGRTGSKQILEQMALIPYAPRSAIQAYTLPIETVNMQTAKAGSCWKEVLVAVLTITYLTACEGERPDKVGTFADWPSGLSSPIEGATFSMSENHLPGAPRAYRSGIHQGFDFFDGFSGRPLAEAEPILAVADGEIVRIDEEYDPRRQARQIYYSQMASEPGFVGEYALDQLRGRQIWIRHQEGHVSRYAHLSEVHPELKPGDSVEQGQVIGLMGNTGIPATETQPEPAPHLHFELWSADGKQYLGQSLSALDSHRAVAAQFSDAALPRYARRVVSQVEAGQTEPDEYPPEPLPEMGFNVEPPERVAAGSAFAIPINWPGDNFEVNDFFALFNGQLIGIIDAGDGAWVLGAAPLEAEGEELEFSVGAIDPFGQTLFGGRRLEVTTPPERPLPREVPAETLAAHTQESLQTEATLLRRLGLQSLTQTEPLWQDVFHGPVDGNVISTFGQPIFQGILRPQFPNPGLSIETSAQAPVLASNDGIVALVETLPIRGRTVAVIHGGGVVSVYANIGETLVEVGEEIARGQQLGTAGTSEETGNSEVNWEIQVAGIPSNPFGWLERILPER